MIFVIQNENSHVLKNIDEESIFISNLFYPIYCSQGLSKKERVCKVVHTQNTN